MFCEGKNVIKNQGNNYKEKEKSEKVYEQGKIIKTK